MNKNIFTDGENPSISEEEKMYFAPNALTSDTVMLSTLPDIEGCVGVNFSDLSSLGFKRAYVDGILRRLTPPTFVNSNPLYLQLYTNTKMSKWLEKIDKGKLLVPIKTKAIPEKDFEEKEVTKVFTKNKTNGLYYVLAFSSNDCFLSFVSKNERFSSYKPVYSDRNERYAVSFKNDFIYLD